MNEHYRVPASGGGCTVFHLNSSMSTLLEQISSLVTLDVDSMDPRVVERHPSIPFLDMTSNQGIAYAEAVRKENAIIVKAALDYARQKAGSAKDPLQDALDMLVRTQVPEMFRPDDHR